jgi:catechol 2,3-dioxygenase-like lactoylglutathione lyase family enzyme
MSRLWLPYEVTDLKAAEKFLTDRLCLSTVDWWDRDGESGRVLAIGDDAVIELVSANASRAAAPALRQPDQATVEALHRRFAPHEVTRPPASYPRGHYGFEVQTPGGFPLTIWSGR